MQVEVDSNCRELLQCFVGELQEEFSGFGHSERSPPHQGQKKICVETKASTEIVLALS